MDQFRISMPITIIHNHKWNQSKSTKMLWYCRFSNALCAFLKLAVNLQLVLKIFICECWLNFFLLFLQKNPKYPDFKHKDTGEALWVEGRYNPGWVKSQLAILDTRMGSLHDEDSRTHVGFMSADELMSFW